MTLAGPCGPDRELPLAIDVAGNLSAGNTIGFSLDSASDISSCDTNNKAITPKGKFPLNGNTFTVTAVSNPSLAILPIESSSIGTTVTAGTQGNMVGAWNFLTCNNNRVVQEHRVPCHRFRQQGRHPEREADGQRYSGWCVTLSTIGQDDTAYFDGPRPRLN